MLHLCFRTFHSTFSKRCPKTWQPAQRVRKSSARAPRDTTCEAPEMPVCVTTTSESWCQPAGWSHLPCRADRGSPPGRSDRILNKCPRRVSTGLRTYSWQLGNKFANFHRPGATPECPRGINKGMRYTRDLTDEQWTILDPLIPKPTRREDGRGRPWKSRRSVLNGVLWVLRTGAPWAELPDRYPSFQTCHRRFQQWVRSGVVTRIMTALAHELATRGAIDVREAFIDASFAPARKGVARSVKRNAARVQRSWLSLIVTGCRFLFAPRVPLPMK